MKGLTEGKIDECRRRGASEVVVEEGARRNPVVGVVRTSGNGVRGGSSGCGKYIGKGVDSGFREVDQMFKG